MGCDNQKSIIYRILKKLSLENFLDKILPSPRDVLLKRILRIQHVLK